MAHNGLMEELQMAIHTGNETAVSELIKCFGLPVDENSDYTLIRMALEEGHEKISRILFSNSKRICSMKKSSLGRLIELALERDYIRFLVLLIDKAIPHTATKKHNNSLFYYISIIEDEIMKDFIINKMTNVSGIDTSDTQNFQLLHLFIGIIRYDYTSLKRFKMMNLNINKSIVAKSSTMNGYTALHIAVLCENDNYVKLLLNSGSKTSVQDARGLSPLHHSLKIENTNVQKTLCCAFLLESNCENPVDHRGISHFHIACMVGSPTKVKLYLQNFTDANRRIRNDTRHYSGYTPLHLAVKEGHGQLVRLLLNYGADVNMMNAEGMSPLHLAVFLQKYRIADILLTARNIGILDNPVDPTGLSHFHIACFRGNISVVLRFLVHSSVDVNAQVSASSPKWPLYSALHFAVLSSCTSIIKILLKNGANPNCQDSEGFTPLNFACFHKLTKSVELLLKFKVDPNIESKRGSTPLQTAIIEGNYDTVKILVEKGVDLNSRYNSNERPPLIIAAFYKQYKIMHYLLKNGANAAAKQRDGKTALHILALPTDPMKALNIFNSRKYFTFEERMYLFSAIGVLDGYTLDSTVKILIKKGCDINARDKMQCTPLHLACQFQRTDVATVLLHLGADIGAIGNLICPTSQYIIHVHGPVAPVVYGHIYKLEYAGCRLSSLNKCFLETHRKLRLLSSNVPSGEQIRYDKELDQMKNETIDNYSSLHDFVIKDPNDLLNYTKNSTLMEYVFHHDFTEFRYFEFGDLIQANFRTAKKRAALFMLAKTSMQLFTKVPLPDICLINIFRYLNDEDVKQLILIL